ncbi:MAG: S8 family serine peptidase, partial [Planctomycetota bacterium]|nr:S8 family serine peptidase [Planctomycetota bacterium]
MRHGDFDPAVAAPNVAAALSAEPASNLYIVQFVTQPLEAYRQALRDRGATVLTFIANNAHVVRMSPEVRAVVRTLPFVRWVGPMHPAYRLEAPIREQIESGEVVEPRRYSIMLFEPGAAPVDRVSEHIRQLGGRVHGTAPRVSRLEATMTLDQVRQVVALDDVMFVDRKGRLEPDMDIARGISGANFIESTLGFTGQGVRAEVADTELDVNHQEWSAPPIIHVNGADVLHGTSVYGILFAQGDDSQARGLIPDGVGIFAFSYGLLGGGPTRYQHTAELVNPLGPYRTVLQTNSTGDPRDTEYTTISAEMDTLLFDHDILICQSQSNAGNRDSRPQAWAKNIVSGGGIRHFNTLDKADDCWGCGASAASIGPASDGRVKPDLCHFYDLTFAPASGGGYTEFGGTSGATPIIAGHFGIAFQMWHEQVFLGFGGGPTVFDSRPHMTTLKAMMINTATQYPFAGQGHDLTRVHQGWGMPDVENLYNLRNDMLIVNETDLLSNLGSTFYAVDVAPSETALRATLVYADPAGNVASSQDRINDLTLKVTSPSNDIYWGNNGLLDGNWSAPGGAPNTVDTVENVFVENPETGIWTVEVFADEINQDGHVETPELDADFALVVSGVTPVLPPLLILLPDGVPETVSPLTPTVIAVRILDGAETLLPASAALHYRTHPADAFSTAPLVPLGGSDYSAVLPGVDCTAAPEFYISAQGDLGSDIFNPASAPLSAHTTEPIVETTFFTDDFELFSGWTVENTDLQDGPWQIGIPVNNGRGDPPADFDGSGKCFLTDNDPLDDNSDVDGGPTRLISPTLDLQNGSDPQLTYARWFTNDDSDADNLLVEISNNNGAAWTVVEDVPNSSG